MRAQHQNGSMPSTFLTALPVYNEEKHLPAVLPEVLRYSPDVLVVDDGSRDGTAELLRAMPAVRVCTHATNEGYGAALRSAFRYALQHRYDVLVTIDCDGQHQPALIPRLVQATREADIVSGSRYLQPVDPANPPPEARRRINAQITEELNRTLGLRLTDAFCGFKAYRRSALAQLRITEAGYGMPLELWVQAARLGLVVQEVPVPLIYLEEHRSFGGALDDSETRLHYYHDVLRRALSVQLSPPTHLDP
jgi:glycosyltransferase involved in cell wall biosynthesis